MVLLVFKVLVTPILIAAATLAGRRWGPGVSGWFAGLPLTSGPVSLIFALQDGAEFARHAALGTIAGLSSVGVYALIYRVLAPRAPWFVAAPLAILAFFAATAGLNLMSLDLTLTFLAVATFLLLLLRWMPTSAVSFENIKPPKWDLPARMLAAVVFILVITSASNLLGPQLSGLLSPFPIFTTILTVFAHRHQGGVAAIQFLRGLVLGLLAFGSFFLVVGALVTSNALALTYLFATALAVGVNAASLRFAR